MIDQEKTHDQCFSTDPKERMLALNQLKYFSSIPDKRQAWNDLVRLTKDKNTLVRSEAAIILVSAFSYVPDKQQAWDDVVRLTKDNNTTVRFTAAAALISVFSHVPDKEHVWNDLVRLTKDKDISVRSEAAVTLGSAFSYVPDKQQAWGDLIGLINDEDSDIRFKAAYSLGSAFAQVPDKQQAWTDLHRLTADENNDVRINAAKALGSVFSYVPDTQQAWNDLHRLTTDENIYVKSGAAIALGSAFSHVPDKQQAWDDLHRLTMDNNMSVRSTAAYTLGFSFYQVPDEFKQQAWDDLHRLTKNKDISVKSEAASALGSVFSQVPDKQQALDDLHRLANDNDSYVRTFSNHSLGRVCIFKASQTETDEDYKKELENAITFFEAATQESDWLNPSKFCLPFYRSFHTVIFKRQERAKDEVDKYLKEAEAAIEGSKNKELLFEAVENLARALEEVQNLGFLDLQGMKGELDFYRKYCDHAAELITGAEEEAPFVVKMIRKGLPLLDRNLKSIIEEIQKAARIVCRDSEGTATQELACSINTKVQAWEIGTIEELVYQAEDLLNYINSSVPKFPENKPIFEKIKEIEDKKDLKLLLKGVRDLFEKLPKIMIDPERMKPTIGIITALPEEYAAVNVLLKNKNDKYKVPGSGAGRRYCLGEILSEKKNKYNLVLANADKGNNIAATRATLLLEHFPNVKSIIMVGIAGGIPNADKVDDHVRLGDIVVSDENGVIQYDLIKQEIQDITHRNSPRPPSSSLLEAVGYLKIGEILGNRPWEKNIKLALSQLKTSRPSETTDILYDSCNQDEVIPHPEDPKRIKDQSRVFTGPVASANILQKDPNARDTLREKFKVKAVEMEGSGIADATWNHEVGYLVVRGICDYCDSHKNNIWHQYAAVVAAAYMRALVESMP